MKTSEVLRLMRAKIESGWTQRWFARTASGYGVSGLFNGATSWCLVGALQVATNNRTPESIGYVNELIGNPWCSWNDDPSRTKEDVLAMLDQAIEAAIKDEEQQTQ